MYGGSESLLRSINASVVQLVLYKALVSAQQLNVFTASDLQPLNALNRLVKYADDTYIIVPASCADTQCSEIDHVESWARENNLQLNRTKTREIIFTDKRRKQGVPELSTLPDVARVSSLKILGVTITNGLSASEPVRNVISNSAQTLHALWVLRAHGMPDEALQVVFRSVVVGRLLYAPCALSGFVTATDRKRVDAFLRRSKLSRFCSPDLASYDELLAEADTRVFSRTSTNSLRVLYHLLPPPSTASQHYIIYALAHLNLPTASFKCIS